MDDRSAWWDVQEAKVIGEFHRILGTEKWYGFYSREAAFDCFSRGVRATWYSTPTGEEVLVTCVTGEDDERGENYLAKDKISVGEVTVPLRFENDIEVLWNYKSDLDVSSDGSSDSKDEEDERNPDSKKVDPELAHIIKETQALWLDCRTLSKELEVARSEGHVLIGYEEWKEKRDAAVEAFENLNRKVEEK
jgi:hypothetical protein